MKHWSYNLLCFDSMFNGFSLLIGILSHLIIDAVESYMSELDRDIEECACSNTSPAPHQNLLSQKPVIIRLTKT